ncbi:ScbA/BarX family gamma-butyrolactone biosynthesis protein [Arthrobacter sp. NPDC090010]|uniref:ScbA/BarX family gamma-butyrolactone biosynthesis protein n=1 Tax=Arthrobacter sp. NPDC090010 TaxID=3363942 RepID=UPI00381F8D50
MAEQTFSARTEDSPQPAGFEAVRFSSPVDRQLVHRISLSEVFLTDIRQAGPSRFLVGAQWPRWHVFYRSPEDGLDSALLAETLRQAVILLAHDRGVPLAHKFLLPSMSLTLDHPSLDPSRPSEVVLDLTVDRFAMRGGSLSTLDVEARFILDGRLLGTGAATARIVDPLSYRRYRRPALGHQSISRFPHRLDPARLGHRDARNVLLGASSVPGSWPLVVDTSHPIFFDHPLDHVPGMLLLEAIRQAARCHSGNPTLDFAHFTAEFLHVVELWHETEVTLTRFQGKALHASIHHCGEVLVRLEALCL